ncbi:hypothetical protein VSS74_13760 [Conexibacter stalactiti]|uniref:Uncharacterized protein n=1 Tax=Conexibacter stalactiti TaxID=1940611 RepID=A0ABU4HQ87_9ACTN|nr:hypothetical protein [Conexibacter stalactiti]MDW5595410.1 hypothetical protein [Conexibacter stalactiti]MEC5036052.1 hypothetical protein [Conexibacter stalactiti]
MRSTLVAGAASIVAALACAAPASADSIAYLKDHNVWLTNPDGSGQYQVTTDGYAGLPYRSPSQADDGTIAVSRANSIFLLRQNGSVIREIDPPGLTNTYSHLVDGSPDQVAISPDGGRIAYMFISFEGGGSDQTRTTTGFVDAAGNRLVGNLYNGYPSWVTNTRLLTSGGYGHHVNLHDQGQGLEDNWLNDNQGDLSDPEVNRQGTRIALVRTVSNRPSIVAYDTVGDVLTGRPAATATARCIFEGVPALSGPSWAPDGMALVWTEPDGLWTMDQAGTCVGQPRLLIAGATEPDWGPAPVNPGPREVPPVPIERRVDPPVPVERRVEPLPVRTVRPTVAAPGTRAQLAKRGVRTSYACSAACTVSVTVVADRATGRALKLRGARVLARGTRRLKAAGNASVIVRPARKLGGRFAKLRRRATLTVRITVTVAGAKAQTFIQRVVV